MDAFQRVRPSDLTATKGINSFDDMEVLGTPRDGSACSCGISGAGLF